MLATCIPGDGFCLFGDSGESWTVSSGLETVFILGGWNKEAFLEHGERMLWAGKNVGKMVVG